MGNLLRLNHEEKEKYEPINNEQGDLINNKNHSIKDKPTITRLY
jgi:hypothetical protein